MWNLKKKSLYVFLMVSPLLPVVSFAQQGDTISMGVITGTLKDTLQNDLLESATISVYRKDNGKLLDYQLSNVFGKFRFKKVPIKTGLKIIATSVGYQAGEVSTQINIAGEEINLGIVNMSKAQTNLKEVSITAKPPLQMRGDTLEFNADAFQLDTNAVIEDMLRRLPGVTVWRDGLITVNGKKVSRLLVEGKEFFGSDAKIALQNLPKNAVDKIQVYKDKESKDPINPPTEMNVILKKDKKSGYFGKFGYGYGTKGRYDSDGMIAFFSPKLQLSSVAAFNNVNKIATNTSTLIGFSSFKGEQIDNDYHSDFSKLGENKFNAFGIKGDYLLKKNENLRADYFRSDIDNNTQETAESIYAVADRKQISQSYSRRSNSSNLSSKQNSAYSLKSDYRDFSVYYNLQHFNDNSSDLQKTNSFNEANGERNSSNSKYITSNDRNELTGGFTFNSRKYNIAGTELYKSIDIDVGYNIKTYKGTNKTDRATDFERPETSNQYFNRSYISKWSGTDQNLSLNLPDLLGSASTTIGNVKVDFISTLSLFRRKEERVVNDLGTLTTEPVLNGQLSDLFDYQMFEGKPGLKLSKRLNKYLTNRFQKIWLLDFVIEGQFSKQENSSTKEFRNLQKSYSNVLPKVIVTYNNDQYGYFVKTYTFNYQTKLRYPTLDDLASIVDDADIYRLNYGNISLKPSYIHELLLSYRFTQHTSKNPFMGSMNIRSSLIENFISDSILYDNLGRSSRYPVNVSNRNELMADLSLDKAFKISDSQFQLNLNANLVFNRTPSYVNSQYYLSKGRSQSGSFELRYTYKNMINATAGQKLFNNTVYQSNINEFNFRNWHSNFGASYSFNKNFMLSTMLNYNKNISTNSPDVSFTIWNADLHYRFLKGSNAEIKFSALDLFRQNKGITNILTYNGFVSRRTNVLQQYFMIAVAYYPRKFGFGKR
jgi:hypothetical protein